MEASYRTRTMAPGEVALALDWAAQEGWNPGLHDAETFQAADASGFLAGVLGDEPVASISMVKYGSGFAFLGLYIVRPEFRGAGHGRRLWQDAMASVAGRQVGLDGVVAQQENYRKSGLAPAWRNVRYAGQGRAGAPSAPRLRALDTLPWAQVLAYDRPFFPEERADFLRAWLAQGDACGLGFVADGRMQGYGLIRRCRNGWKIGPLFADSETIAEALYLALAARAERGEPVYLDIPEPNPAAVALTRRHGMRMMFETARMYTGTAPAVPMARMYGITSFELG
jgi:ribosomal protein S18 acetylase RimI-like enzyme